MSSSLDDVTNSIRSTDSAVPQESLGFGQHVNPGSEKLLSSAERTNKIASLLLGFGTLATALVIVTVSFAFPPAIITAIAVGLATVAILGVSKVIASINLHRAKCRTLGIHNETEKPDVVPLGKYAKGCQGIATVNSMESYEWKKRLIQAANHSIVLSGNSCGGRVFDDVLELIDKRMQEKQQLKVLIISSDIFLTKKNRQKIALLRKGYPDRFTLVEDKGFWHISTGLKKTMNHAKALVIDYGRYSVIGGGLLHESWTEADGTGRRQDSRTNDAGFSIIRAFLADQFRDMSFVIHDPNENGAGYRTHIELLRLAKRLKAMNAWWNDTRTEREVKNRALTNRLPFKGDAARQMEETHIEEFHNPEQRHEGMTGRKAPVTDMNVKMFASGPEHTRCDFLEELIDHIAQAKERIVMVNQYCNFPPRLKQALIDAANRGIQIKFLTNGNHSRSNPIIHQLFGRRNRHEVGDIFRTVKKENRHLIELYEYNPIAEGEDKLEETITFHKKVSLIDNHVFCGSSNIGYKSMKAMSDYELNFVTDSKEFADNIIELINEDLKLSTGVRNVAKWSVINAAVAGISSVLDPLIG